MPTDADPKLQAQLAQEAALRQRSLQRTRKMQAKVRQAQRQRRAAQQAYAVGTAQLDALYARTQAAQIALTYQALLAAFEAVLTQRSP